VQDSKVFDHYRNMSDSDKIIALKQAIHIDERPLHVLLAMLTILEPDKVEVAFDLPFLNQKNSSGPAFQPRA